MNDRPTILGLDLGAASIGWALLSARADGDSLRPAGLVAAGVRIFQAGMDGNMELGREESRAKGRRDARLARRQTERRARRLRTIFNALRAVGLLPTYPGLDLSSSAGRHETILRLDREIRDSGRLDRLAQAIGVHGAADKLPYVLRAAALDHPLEPHELGRALYHLAQRRGFLSNRRSPRRDDDEGVVLSGISQLRDDMARTSSRTLGEHLSRIDPHHQRIRARYTARAMLIDEFEAIWTSQERFHPTILTPELKKRIYHRIFHQRPLKSQSDKIGRCELEPKRRRAPWALLAAQRFRLLQSVNNLRIRNEYGVEYELTPEQRQVLIAELDRKKEVTFKGIRRLLKMPDVTFNLERGGDKAIRGNETNAILSKVFGDRWWQFDVDTRDAIIEDLLSIQKTETLERRGHEVWELDAAKAREFAKTRLPDGHCRFSRRALAKLLPHLEEGLNIQLAIERAYPDHRLVGWAHELLPPVKHVLPDLRNPAVTRTLTELRKVVNAIIKRYGRPAEIHIELARDLRRSKDERQRLLRKNRDQEVMRKAAAKEIREAGEEPTPRAIERLLLAKECEFTCPYTGRKFTMAALLSPESPLDVDHIIPFHRSLDDSFANKTLCFAEENRHVKRGRTPFEAYGGTARWNDILDRVRNFKGRLAGEKLFRFQLHGEELEQWLSDFTSRQLNDTRYASRLALRYLSLLFGGTADGVDPDGKRRITVVTGQTTAHVRNWLRLGSILGDGGVKARDDHRHHAVDAIAIALTSQRTVQKLSIASRNQLLRKGRLYGEPEAPWPTFLEDVRETISRLVVSPRVERRVRGPLHNETFYSPRLEEGAKSPEGRYVHYTKPLADLSPSMVEKIVDPTVRRLVIEALAGGEPKDVFKDESRLPRFVRRNGKTVPIRKVRIRDKVTVTPIGKGDRQRFVQTSGNHHLEVFEVTDAKGRTRWEGRVVSMLEAYERIRKDLPVVNREYVSGSRFLFSLVGNPGGDVLELDEPDGTRGMYIVESIWMEDNGARVRIRPLNQARPGNGRIQPMINVLGRRHCRKVSIDPLGNVTYAND